MNALDEDWDILVGLLPPSWQRAARLSGAVERLRELDSVEALLRRLLMHVGCGYSLRETTVRAQAAGLSKVSDVTLLNRLRQSENWLQHLCQALLAESGVRWKGPPPRRRLRALDGTVIKEPGPTGSHWRIHYSLRLPELACDQLLISSRKGAGTAENLERFRVAAGQAGQWAAALHAGEQRVEGRLCAVRKSAQAIAAAERQLDRREQKQQIRVRPETREYAHYVMVFTTLRVPEMGAPQVLEYYRFRWQIELVFKRLKSLLAIGHLPKHDARSSRAWWHGKLLVALLTQKLVRLGSSFSPWGYELGSDGPGQSVA